MFAGLSFGMLCLLALAAFVALIMLPFILAVAIEIAARALPILLAIWMFFTFCR